MAEDVNAYIRSTWAIQVLDISPHRAANSLDDGLIADREVCQKLGQHFFCGIIAIFCPSHKKCEGMSTHQTHSPSLCSVSLQDRMATKQITVCS